MLKSRKLTIALFVCYLAVLAWVILGKSRFAFRFLGLQFNFVEPNPQRSLNLIPFGGMLVLNGRPDYNEILLNALVFVPFGVFLGMLGGKRKFVLLALPMLLTSLLFEGLQYAWLLGASDITDVLANAAGGLAGLGLCALGRKVCGERAAQALNAAGLAAAAGFVLVMSMVRPL